MFMSLNSHTLNPTGTSVNAYCFENEQKFFLILERNNSYYFSRANQQKAGTKIYSLTQCSLTVNKCDWHILAGNDERINSHYLIRYTMGAHENFQKIFGMFLMF